MKEARRNIENTEESIYMKKQKVATIRSGRGVDLKGT